LIDPSQCNGMWLFIYLLTRNGSRAQLSSDDEGLSGLDLRRQEDEASLSLA